MARAVKPAKRAKVKLQQARRRDLQLVLVRSCPHCDGGSHELGACPALDAAANDRLARR